MDIVTLDDITKSNKIETNTIINADCLEAMRYINDKSIDMILCDLPYQLTDCKWDSLIPFDKLWEHYKRIIKPAGAIVLTASQPFTSMLVMSNPKWFRYEWVWIKNRGGFFALAKKMPMKEHESVLVFYNKTPTYNPIKQERALGGQDRIKYKHNNSSKSDNYKCSPRFSKPPEKLRYPSSHQKFNIEVGLHPTQKPLALFEYMIKTYTNEGETVLDNCAGSFTTALAAKNTKRKWICMEQERKYCEIGLERLCKDKNII